jgi:acetoin utilization deacetylase AcuC-like enzyme
MGMTPGVSVTPIAVFYDEAMIADSESYSPGSSKPRPVVQACLHQQLSIEVKAFPPVTREDLFLAHNPEYVSGVLEGRIPNGFGNCSKDVACSLPYTSGAMLAAARHALKHGIACAPVGGFHHAHFDGASGFCTFNGLLVTVIKLLNEGRVRRVMILDTDQHLGDGTDDILTRLSLYDRVEHMSFGRLYNVPDEADNYLRRLRDKVSDLAGYDLILFHTGADTHVDDPLGGVLTTKQMMMRDRMVFKAARAAGVPLAWCLAGGYQKPLSKVVALHVNTMTECIAAYSP